MRNQEIQELARRKRRRKPKLRWGRIIAFGVLLIMLLTLSVWGGNYLYQKLFSPKPQMQTTMPENSKFTEEIIGKRINVLFLGIDDGDSDDAPDDPKRTDAMMLASIDPVKKHVSIISIPRDAYVPIPGVGPEKANAAFSYGGVSLAKKTVANLLEIPIQYYVLMDWQGFTKIIDILGGVDMYVEDNMDYEDPYADLYIHIKQGFQHLDGLNSGKYIRFRHDEMGDIGRVQRQQRFLKALLEQHLTLNTIGKVPDIAKALDNYIQTDIPMMEMIKLINTVKGIEKSSVKSAMLPGTFADIKKVSYWKINEQQLKDMLRDLDLAYTK